MADAVVAAASNSERVQKELSDIRYGIQRAVQLSEGVSIVVEEVTGVKNSVELMKAWRTEVVTEVQHGLEGVHKEFTGLRDEFVCVKQQSEEVMAAVVGLKDLEVKCGRQDDVLKGGSRGSDEPTKSCRRGISARVPKAAENLAGETPCKNSVKQQVVVVQKEETKVRKGSSSYTAKGAGESLISSCLLYTSPSPRD